jgi:hypothetical protein
MPLKEPQLPLPRARTYWELVKRFADGNGRSSQEVLVFEGTGENDLKPTGISFHVCFYSRPPKSEAEEPNRGPSDLQGVAEYAYEYKGSFYGSWEKARDLYEKDNP